jgi:5-methylcytosine-specific restriction protein A
MSHLLREDAWKVKPRKTAWMRDEVIVALDLYLREGKNPHMALCAEVSSVLRSIPIEAENRSDPKFRSPKSVATKMQNFVSLDPKVARAGYSNVGQMDRDVWEEFADDPIRLRAVAEAIRANVDTLSPTEIEDVPDDSDEMTEAEEGAILTVVHKRRERSAKLRKAKKKQVLAKTGRLACAACDLDFGERYGERGDGFIECHHTIPVSSLRPGERTKIEDLVLLCPNCHRMVHVRRPWLTLDRLIAIQSTAG